MIITLLLSDFCNCINFQARADVQKRCSTIATSIFTAGLSTVCLSVLKPMPTADLLPLVFITLIIGYADKENNYFRAETKFATAMISIIPLSYYIGMGIAR